MLISLERFKGKFAVVTGASAGIGAAILEKLILEGVNVIGLARRVERIEKLAEKLNKLQKGKVYSVKCDITKEEDVVEAFGWIDANLGPIHVLVNNAGVLRPTSLINGDFKLWKNTVDTNVLGLCVATREVVRSMKKHNVAGHIVNINSILGHPGPYFPKSNIYPATKCAVTALTDMLYRELLEENSKIKISSLSPGYVETEIFFNEGQEKLREYLQTVPHLSSDEVAEAVVYVLSTPPGVQIKELIIKPLGEAF